MRRHLLSLWSFLASALPAQVAPAPLLICTSTPDLASLARAVGGDAVTVTSFGKGVEDPHFVEARPGFIKALSRAELWIEVGLDLEVGWAPLLLQQCRNAGVARGSAGFVDASEAIKPLGVPSGNVDRSLGDVHALGNPHYLLDPVNGWAVARRIRDRMIALRPTDKTAYEQRCREFGRSLGQALVGKELADQYEWEKLVTLHEHGRLTAFLESQHDGPLLGWLGAVAPFAGTKIVVDHDLWPYFAHRFGLVVIAQLEPLPGVPPTTRHLQSVIARAKAEGAKAILASPYYDSRHADLVAKETGAKVVRMAHQTGGRPGTGEYLEMIGTNVRAIVEALQH